MATSDQGVRIEVHGHIATITLNRPASLNALRAEDYDAFATGLREIDKRDDVLVTVWQAAGNYFCAGTDFKRSRPWDTNRYTDAPDSVRQAMMRGAADTTLDCSQALYRHSKILVAAINGPVMGIAAAFLGQFDFIYALPGAWLSVPFTFLGIVAEGGSSVTFANRMGTAKANEELLACGFYNEIFPTQSTEDFHTSIRRKVEDELRGLDPTALLTVKHLLKEGQNEKNNYDAANLREAYAQAERFASGVPADRFGMVARKELRHKL
ncbi:ClpP/crotonase-like domain-containing protein [Schizophyllum amplum]|uniref:ClpP/crotonase-like domain-containing protein n=1 Tax=Schizophyllum amplum TaxID=97359 RepID=A0A550C1L8_9AGAR|nr:ClpP/crotonase-like domain-containing protein [Auriculariopsis ampla]